MVKNWERQRRNLARSKMFTKLAVIRLIGKESIYLREKGFRLKEAFSQGVIAEHETWRSPERYGLGNRWDDKYTLEVDGVDELEVKGDGDTHEIIASCTMKRENSPLKTGVKIHLMVYAREPFGQRFDISLLEYDGHRL